MAAISLVSARQIIDSRGIPTVEATVQLSDGTTASSSVPGGSTVQKDEALELRDGGTEYFGLGVSKAVNNVNTLIASKLKGMDPLYQTQVDQALVDLDGTANKSRLGSNAILAVSQAVMKAAATSLHLPLFVYVKEKYQLVQNYRIPTPVFNLMTGGQYGAGTLDFKEFQLVPASHLPYTTAFKIGVEMFMAIEKILEQKGAIRSVGLKGGFSPNLATNADALEIFAEAIKLTSYNLAQDAFLGLDVGPRWFFKSGKYTVKDRPQPMTPKEMVKFFQELHQQYRVFSFEDPFMPDAWADWKFMTAELGSTAMIIADDLVATNKTRLIKAIQERAANTLVLKPNRVGTITETIEIAHLAKEAGWHTIMSHRSGETTDDVLADLAVGIGTDYVKFGAPSRGERVVKYNRLLRIEEILQQLQGKGTMDVSQPTNAMPGAMMPPATPPPGTPSAPSMPTVDTAPIAPVAPSMPESVTPAAPTPVAMPTPSASPAPLTVGSTTPEPMTAPTPTVSPTMTPTPEMPPTMPAPTPVPLPGTSETAPSPVAPSMPAAPAPVAAPSESTPDLTEIQTNLDTLAGMVQSPSTTTASTSTPTMSTSPSTAAMPSPVMPGGADVTPVPAVSTTTTGGLTLTPPTPPSVS